jgi:hypothetical protein
LAVICGRGGLVLVSSHTDLIAEDRVEALVHPQAVLFALLRIRDPSALPSPQPPKPPLQPIKHQGTL